VAITFGGLEHGSVAMARGELEPEDAGTEPDGTVAGADARVWLADTDGAGQDRHFLLRRFRWAGDETGLVV